MPTEEIPEKFLARVKAVTAKRPKAVIDHILKHGSVTTEQLEKLYNQAPRAARDVREQGIPLKTIMVKDSDGRRCARYSFDFTIELDGQKIGGRKAFAKNVKDALIARDGEECAVCTIEYPDRYLQVDHCVPYEVAGESLSYDLDQLMLLCGSCNRGKSWSCEHCENWKIKKDIKACQSCYWVSPNDYTHIALVQIRRADVVWKGDEVKLYDRLRAKAKKEGVEVPVLIKGIVRASKAIK